MQSVMLFLSFLVSQSALTQGSLKEKYVPESDVAI